MDSNQKYILISLLKDKIYQEHLMLILNSLEVVNFNNYNALISSELRNPLITLTLSVSFGVFGVDRFYIGDVGLGISKIFFGWLTLFIWPALDIYFCYKKTKEKNFNTIHTHLYGRPYLIK